MSQKPRKRAIWIGDKQSIRCRVPNTGYKDAQGLSNDLNIIKKIQSEIRDTLIKINNNLQGNNSRVDEAENQINDVEHKEAKTTNQNIKNVKIIQRKEDSLSRLWDNLKRSNIHTIGVPEGEEKEQEVGNLSGKKWQNFFNLVKEIYMQVQEESSKQNRCKEAYSKTHRN